MGVINDLKMDDILLPDDFSWFLHIPTNVEYSSTLRSRSVKKYKWQKKRVNGPVARQNKIIHYQTGTEGIAISMPTTIMTTTGTSQ